MQAKAAELLTAITAPDYSSSAAGGPGYEMQAGCPERSTGTGDAQGLDLKCPDILASDDRTGIRVARFAACSARCRATRAETQAVGCPDLSLSMVALGG